MCESHPNCLDMGCQLRPTFLPTHFRNRVNPENEANTQNSSIYIYAGLVAAIFAISVFRALYFSHIGMLEPCTAAWIRFLVSLFSLVSASVVCE